MPRAMRLLLLLVPPALTSYAAAFATVASRPRSAPPPPPPPPPSSSTVGRRRASPLLGSWTVRSDEPPSICDDAAASSSASPGPSSPTPSAAASPPPPPPSSPFDSLQTDVDLPSSLPELLALLPHIPPPAADAADAASGSSRFHALTPPQRYVLRLSQLLEYNATHGTTDVPISCAENRALANWVKTQRYERRLSDDGRESWMTNERRRVLDCVGFEWRRRDPELERAGLTAPWLRRFERAAAEKTAERRESRTDRTTSGGGTSEW